MNKDKMIISILIVILTVGLMNLSFRLIDKYFERQFLIKIEQMQQELEDGIN